jgi:hypothetical protein
MSPLYLTDLLHSKLLKEAGVEQTSEYWWNTAYNPEKSKNETWLSDKKYEPKYDGEDCCSAFLSDELLNMLPFAIGDKQFLVISKMDDGGGPTGGSICVYYEHTPHKFEAPHPPQRPCSHGGVGEERGGGMTGQIEVQCLNCEWIFFVPLVEEHSIVDCPKCGYMVNVEEERTDQ